MFGSLGLIQINLSQLKLEAYRDGKKVMSRKDDMDLPDLLTKQYN